MEKTQEEETKKANEQHEKNKKRTTGQKDN